MGDDERMVVRPWFDVFLFDDAWLITCPDCDERSPGLPDIWAVVRWSDRHQRSCPA